MKPLLKKIADFKCVGFACGNIVGVLAVLIFQQSAFYAGLSAYDALFYAVDLTGVYLGIVVVIQMISGFIRDSVLRRRELQGQIDNAIEACTNSAPFDFIGGNSR